MKKRFASLVALSMALTLAFGMTVSAAGSTDTASTNVSQEALNSAATAVTTASTTVVDESGNTVAATVSATPITTANVGAAEKALDAGLASSDLEQKDGGLVTGFDLNVTVGGAAVTNVTVTFPVPGVVAGGDYRILHWNGTIWEIITPSNVAAGKLTATFATLSPVVVIEVAEKDDDGDDGDDSSDAAATTTATGAPASPKTGEVLPVAGMMALISLAGAAVCAKKARF